MNIMNKTTTFSKLKRYKWYANLILIFAFIGFVIVDYLIISAAINQAIASNGPIPHFNNGFIWGALLLGLLLVLNISLTITDKCLTSLVKEETES